MAVSGGISTNKPFINAETTCTKRFKIGLVWFSALNSNFHQIRTPSNCYVVIGLVMIFEFENQNMHNRRTNKRITN